MPVKAQVRAKMHAGRRLLGLRPFALAILEAALALAFTLSIYAISTAMEAPEARTRLLSFTAIVIANLSLILFARSGERRLWRPTLMGRRQPGMAAGATRPSRRSQEMRRISRPCHGCPCR